MSMEMGVFRAEDFTAGNDKKLEKKESPLF